MLNEENFLEEFKNPGGKYRPIPFWSWNGDVNPEEVKRQIQIMSRSGVGGYFMHARGGLSIPYLGKEWFDSIKAGIEAGKENHLDAWIYDEEGWPSGFAGGIVPAMSPEYQAKFMVLEEHSCMAEIETKAMIAIYLLKPDLSFCCVYKNASFLPGYETYVCSEGETLLSVRKKVQKYYIDVMNKEAVDAFIRETHEKYYERFKEEFGTGMKGFFTDEPRFTCNRFGELAWSDKLPGVFFDRYGYDILEVMPLLWREYQGFEKVRYDFWRACNDMFVKSYMKNIYDWCEAHNCMLTGHIMLEESIFGQMTSTGGVMPCYEYEHIPGIDWLRRRIESPVIGKQVGSVACQLGKKRVISESFAMSGWNVSFEELKWIMDWEYVNGVNMICQHLQAYTLKGVRKRDYPPSLYIQQSWYDKYHLFNDYAGRLGLALAEGDQVADVLLLHPMRSGYLCFDGTRTQKIRDLDDAFTRISRHLSSQHISYHYGDETIIGKYGRVEEGRFLVGRIPYRTVIMPCMYSIDEVTLNLLLQFIQEGGTVLSVGEFPAYTNGSQKALKALREKVLFPSYEEILPMMKEAGLVSVSISCQGAEAEEIAYQQRKCGEEEILFMANHSQTLTYETTVRVYNQGVSVRLLKADTGTTEEIPCEIVKEEGTLYTEFHLTFLPMQSYLVMLTKAESGKAEERAEEQTLIVPGDTWTIEKMGYNSLTLDMCWYRVDKGELLGPIPAIKLMNELLSLKRPCDIQLYYRFKVEMDLEKNREFKLALEDSDRFTVTVNGQQAGGANGWWKDKAIATIDIKPFIQKGDNEIILSGRFEQDEKVYQVLFGENVYETEKNKITYQMEIESVYLLGDFGVAPETSYEKSVKNPKTGTLFFSDGPFMVVDAPTCLKGNTFTDQGLWFFAETLAVSQKFTADPVEGRRMILFYGKHKAPMMDIYVNGALVKTSLWAPYEADITEYVSRGENTLTFVLYASNRNLFGPHHHISGEPLSVGPESFTGKWSWVERDTEADATDFEDRTRVYWNDPYCFVEFGVR